MASVLLRGVRMLRHGFKTHAGVHACEGLWLGATTFQADSARRRCQHHGHVYIEATYSQSA